MSSRMQKWTRVSRLCRPCRMSPQRLWRTLKPSSLRGANLLINGSGMQAPEVPRAMPDGSVSAPRPECGGEGSWWDPS